MRKKKQKKAIKVLFDFVKIIQDKNSFDYDEIKMIISQRVEWYGDIIFQLLDDLIEWFTDIDKLSDGLGKPRLGCIIIPMFCSSVTGCFTVLEYVNSSQYKEHLSRISTIVSTLFGFSCSFNWVVEPTSLQSSLAFYWDDIGTESSKKKLKNLVLPIHVTNIEGLIKIWKMFGGKRETVAWRIYLGHCQQGLLSHSSGNMNEQSIKELDYSADEEKLEDKRPTQLKPPPPHGVQDINSLDN
ncbi:uncharacterized protein LOC132720164 [Ruditapes philippinarum]|uniref:uncharacterized protein LOC132720164 n=1 Tax=Ruditapes philippinarum TaxID=129788 RepID=UPI00295A7AD9|nr:uncharacterized protein LOC132720164 [Ruditapes philippinarum]